MAQWESKPALATTTVFDMGKFPFTCKKVETSNCDSPQTSGSTPPPKPLLIVTPTTSGEYPVILFLHGFYLRTCFYSQLLEHISSHGYIVVAPQLYLYIPPNGLEEVELAGRVTDWLSSGLQSQLPENVEANLLKLALAGHSRGGKAAFALALGYAKTSLKFSVLLGIDLVAGCNKLCQTKPHILTYVPRSFNLSIPVTVIGTGLGPEQRNCMSPPCAPDGMNHEEFFNECKPPCAHFVAKDYGHMDMLNDDPSGIVGEMSGCMCVNGKGSRDLMRRSVGGIVVAFLRAYLEGESGDLVAILDDPKVAPAKLEQVEFIGA
uniref:chlorophyllase n=1 Tax=Fagus sylvatica TaxID=28930 RepID=A0A2N9GFK4_FAGSY